MVFGFILLVIIILVIDLSTLLKAPDKKRTILLYFFLLSIGLLLGLFQIIDQMPPSPAHLIEAIIHKMGGR
ncbi:MAG: hypothetical protein AB2421_08590 [Thermotaleaceae bacterium]